MSRAANIGPAGRGLLIITPSLIAELYRFSKNVVATPKFQALGRVIRSKLHNYWAPPETETRQCTQNATLRRVRATIVAVEKSIKITYY